jgi:hypothetical protein
MKGEYSVQRRREVPTPYQYRCIVQLERWVNGKSKHNKIDGECCPDFSCCMPGLMEPDRAKRIEHLNQYLRRLGLPTRSDS